MSYGFQLGSGGGLVPGELLSGLSCPCCNNATVAGAQTNTTAMNMLEKQSLKGFIRETRASRGIRIHQQRICSQRRLVGCKGEQTLALLQETSKWVQSQVNTQSRQRGPLVQAMKAPLNPQSYPTFESYIQVREPKSITRRLRAAHINDAG